ncbi:gamma-glutamylcyclotransferase [Robbsia andropogonis]|uniref:gamma-glutamylcyclotransferase n=1 Tax=Robbsia andropogonis TaxID=28092 RepID=UPI003D1D98C2
MIRSHGDAWLPYYRCIPVQPGRRAGVPAHLRWSTAAIEASMHDTLAQLACARPAAADASRTGDVWLFAYGSLIWNPQLRHGAQHIATLSGWHRRFCQKLIAGRGSPQLPGRMLALCPGGETRGLIYRIAAADLLNELRLVWIREMAMGAYVPTWVEVTLEDGSQVKALAFVANSTHPHFDDEGDLPSVAAAIAQAQGPWGSNAEYLWRLQSALSAHAIEDAYIHNLADAVNHVQQGVIEALRQQRSRSSLALAA